MELQSILLILLVPFFVLFGIYVILVLNLVSKIIGKQNYPLWMRMNIMRTGIDEKTGKLVTVVEDSLKNKDKPKIFEFILPRSLLFQFFFSKKLKEQYPSEVKLIKIIGIPAWILLIVSIFLVFWIVIQTK